MTTGLSDTSCVNPSLAACIEEGIPSVSRGVMVEGGPPNPGRGYVEDIRIAFDDFPVYKLSEVCDPSGSCHESFQWECLSRRYDTIQPIIPRSSVRREITIEYISNEGSYENSIVCFPACTGTALK